MTRNKHLWIAAAALALGRSAALGASCPDGRELDGRALEATVTFAKTGRVLVLALAPQSCAVEDPRDEPFAPPYTRRAYRSADGAALSVYSDATRPTSTLSLSLADGSHSATLIPPVRTDALASGGYADLGQVLLVKLDARGQNGVVIPVKLAIRSLAP
jgi:hypothetical protein